MSRYLFPLCLLSIHKVICYDGENENTEIQRRKSNAIGIESLYQDEEGIVGGSKAEKGQYPWFARAIYERDVLCGGTLVASDLVLTAGHCVQQDLLAFEIGSLCPKKKGNCGQKKEYRKVKKVIVHPKFDYYSYDGRYDFALIKLEKPSTIQPASLDLSYISKGYRAGKELWAVGYGKRHYDANYYSEYLRHVQVNYWSQIDCQNSIDYSKETKIDYTMLCALGNSIPHTDTCDGDSGGPLYDKDEGKVVGVSSWGIGCASAYPAVYARVTSVRWWIKDKICKFSRDKSDFHFCKANVKSESQ